MIGPLTLIRIGQPPMIRIRWLDPTLTDDKDNDFNQDWTGNLDEQVRKQLSAGATSHSPLCRMSSSNNSKGKKCIGNYIGYGTTYVSDNNKNKNNGNGNNASKCIGDYMGYESTYASKDNDNGNNASKGKSCIGDYMGYGSTHVSDDNGNNPSKGSSKKPIIGDLIGYGKKSPPTNN
ncbi:uncharacterized protein LOC129319642 [Prosopis cineraria]|uniref:uncharacterized protein LOC129319642 n=1 Tax=Prosopis cineraria TaxID=364024 RepID=UPI002410932A|nr:uncharacterized protein LOC129319642 [Prosopis cineraria]